MLSEFFIALIIGVIFSLNLDSIQNVPYLLLFAIVLHNLLVFQLDTLLHQF